MKLMVIFASTVLLVVTSAVPQDYRTTPVPILKQINRHNDDGSYSYGYEGADGTFKIETKYPSGEVYGKYGYIGDDGKLREVEYGASKRGFEPAGSDINVAPPTLSNSIDNSNLDYDDGQYREDPSVYYSTRRPTINKAFAVRRFPVAPPVSIYRSPHPSQNQFPVRTPVHYFDPQSRFRSFPFSYDSVAFSGHPATNFDINTGSYTITY